MVWLHGLCKTQMMLMLSRCMVLSICREMGQEGINQIIGFVVIISLQDESVDCKMAISCETKPDCFWSHVGNVDHHHVY